MRDSSRDSLESSVNSSFRDVESIAALEGNSINSSDVHNNLDEGNQTEFSEAARIPSIAEEAVIRKLSRIQSRRSIEARRTTTEISRIATNATTAAEELKYGRFTKGQKHSLVALATSLCFLLPMSSLAFLPAVPRIADDLHTSGEVINISAAVYCVGMAISPCVFSPCSDIYGRKPTFVICLGLFTICTILVAVLQDLAMFYVFRLLLGIFGTAFFTTSAHIVSDIYKPTERGTAMGWVICGTQAGPALGPVIGGIIVTYTSWRVIFWVLAGCGAAIFGLVLVFMPETSVETKMQIVLREIHEENPNKKFVWISYNPFRVIRALRFPNLLLGGFIVMSLTFTMNDLLTPITYVVDPRFNLTTPIYSALFYLPPGFGYLVGSLFGGRWADYVVKKNIKNKGRRIPEDRIKATLIPLGIVYPVTILIYGWSLETKKGGMALPIIVMFIGGISQTFIFPASNAYCVDSLPELGGDAIGSSYFSRYIASAVASATCLTSINKIGIGLTCTISAIILWVAAGCAFCLVLYGERLRILALRRYNIPSKHITSDEKKTNSENDNRCREDKIEPKGAEQN